MRPHAPTTHSRALFVALLIGLLAVTGLTQPARALPTAAAAGGVSQPFTIAHDARLNVTTAGLGTTDAGATNGSVSAAGERVVFESDSNALDPTANNTGDVFVRHRAEGITTLASRSSGGTSGNGASEGPRLSADGRFVAFSSAATNLVADDDNETVDSFVHDLETGITRLVSVPGTESRANRVLDIADDGRLILVGVTANEPDEQELVDLYVVDWRQEQSSRVAGATTTASVPASLSGDGRILAFISLEKLTEFDRNSSADVYSLELATGELTVLSVDGSGMAVGGIGSAVAITADGSRVLYTRMATELEASSPSWLVVVRNLQAADSFSLGGDMSTAMLTEPIVSINRTGSHVGISTAAALDAGDSNGVDDVYRLEIATQSIHRVTLDRHGDELTHGATLSAGGHNITDDGLVVIVESSSDQLALDDSNGATDLFAATPAETCRGQFVSVFLSAAEQPTGLDDVILGTAASDDIDGLSGDDLICAGEGDDFVLGGAGDDQIYGEAGSDVLEGGAGNDLISGGSGNDQIFGGEGKDRVLGEAGDDDLEGGSGRDRLFGASGDDVLKGDRGADYLHGGSGDDRLFGGASKDRLLGSSGSDDLRGGKGRDTLKGGGGDDRLDGGKGRDKLRGGNGDDICIGGPEGDPARDRLSRCERDG